MIVSSIRKIVYDIMFHAFLMNNRRRKSRFIKPQILKFVTFCYYNLIEYLRYSYTNLKSFIQYLSLEISDL